MKLPSKKLNHFFLSMALVMATAVTLLGGVAMADQPLPGFEPMNPDERIDRGIEGEDARYFLEAILEASSQDSGEPTGQRSHFVDTLIHEVFPRLVRVRLRGNRSDLEILALFESPIHAEFKSRKEAARLGLYAIEIPKVLKLRLAYRASKIVIEPIPGSPQSLALLFRVPIVSDRVFLHRVEFNPTDGSIEAEAGVLGNHLNLVVNASLYAKKFDGINYRRTLHRNYGVFLIPLLRNNWSLVSRSSYRNGPEL